MPRLHHLHVQHHGTGVRLYTVTSRPSWFHLGAAEALLLLILGCLRIWYQNDIAGWYAVLPCFAWIVCKTFTRRKETFLVMRAIGVQTASQLIIEVTVPFFDRQLRLPVGFAAKQIIPAHHIKDILLLEGIQGWSVIWYLAVAEQVDSRAKVHVIFKAGLPRLKILKPVWRGARELLYESKDRSSEGVDPDSTRRSLD